MSKIEVIYLRHKKTEQIFSEKNQKRKQGYIQEKTQNQTNLISQVKIHKNKKTKKEKKPKQPQNFNLEHKTIKKRNYQRIFSIFTILCILISTTGLIAFDTGYLPVKALLPTKDPVGSVGSIEINNLMEQYKKITGIPDIEDLKYKLYISEASPDNIIENYKYQLKQKGYKLEHRGVITKKGIEFEYYGFTEGITAIGLLITDEIDQIVSQKTTILYTTGSIFDYQDIISWYKSN